LVLVLVTTLGCAAEERPAAEGPEIDEKAAEVLQALTAKVSAAQHITIRGVETIDAALADVVGRSGTAHLAVSVRRPDRFVASMVSEDRERRLFFDGQTFSILHVKRNFYSSVPMAGDFDHMVSVLAERFDFSPPVVELLLSDSYEYILRDLESLTYVGEETVGATRSHRISAVEELFAWDLWISVDGYDLVKLVATATSLEGRPQVVLEFTEIDLESQLDDALFVFEPPPGARQIRMVTVDEM